MVIAIKIVIKSNNKIINVIKELNKQFLVNKSWKELSIIAASIKTPFYKAFLFK